MTPAISRPLYVVTAKPAEYPLFRQIAIEWVYTAQEYTWNPDAKDATSVFLRSEAVAVALQEKLASPLPPRTKALYVCRDLQHRVQALCLSTITDKGLRIDFLLTHPHNIRSLANKDKPERTRGAASALLFYAEKQAQDLFCSQIYLHSSNTAIGFYQRLNFKLTETGEMVKPVLFIAEKKLC
jgi:hypothetical protein